MSQKSDDLLSQALERLAQDDSTVSPDFSARLAAIPDAHIQRRGSLAARILKAFGGWGFAAPQLAGLVLAAFLGFSSAAPSTGMAESDDDLTLMTAHVFTGDDSWGFDEWESLE